MRNAWPFFLLACAAEPEPDVRRPCRGATAWDPSAPLAIRWDSAGRIGMNEHVARRIRVFDATGAQVEGAPFSFEGGLGWCLAGGLAPDTAYTWDVTPGTLKFVQEWDEATTAHVGLWSFTTAPAATWPPPASVEECVTLADDPIYDTDCGDDTADTGA